jgi:hypothetical protein
MMKVGDKYVDSQLQECDVKKEMDDINATMFRSKVEWKLNAARGAVSSAKLQMEYLKHFIECKENIIDHAVRRIERIADAVEYDNVVFIHKGSKEETEYTGHRVKRRVLTTYNVGVFRVPKGAKVDDGYLHYSSYGGNVYMGNELSEMMLTPEQYAGTERHIAMKRAQEFKQFYEDREIVKLGNGWPREERSKVVI